jgi:hypothetical protein
VADVTIRVVQWGTGSTGSRALAGVLDASGLDLVGVRVYESHKVGADAGDLAGRGRTGVVATNDMAEILALDPDVVLYMGRVEQRFDDCLTDIADLLAAGIDVITTGSSLIDATTLPAVPAERLSAACQQGSSTFLGLGLFPGFWGETFAPILSRLSMACDRIVVRESLSYAGYPSAELMFDIMGYGRPPDSDASVMSDPGRAGAAFLGTATIIAKALGLKVTQTLPFRDVAITDTELHVAAGTIAAGTVGAMKIGLQALCGPLTIAVEHVTWMSPDVAPDWSRREGYEIEFGGSPTLRCHLELGIEGEDHTAMGCLATAMHAVNAVPVVHAAAPGLLDLADLPGFVGGSTWAT